MSKNPFFSVIVCTRNRPDILRNCILSLKWQTFQDFEVILSDNSDSEIQEINLSFVKDFNFKNLRYVRPEGVLNMTQNYNFGLSHAKGKYVGVLTDKNMLKNTALKDLYEYLKENEVDIINYGHDGCEWYPDKIFKWVTSGTIRGRNYFERYNPQDELLRRFSLALSRRKEGNLYNYGKIFFGFYHQNLVKQIIEKYKNLFWILSPDYSSAALALHYATNAVFYHKKIMVAINTYAGTGRKASTDSGATMKYIETCTNDITSVLNALPIPNVYASPHNFCAYDYQILNRLGGYDYQVNLKNLAHRVYEDLQIFPFESDLEKKDMFDNFNKFIRKNSIEIERNAPTSISSVKNKSFLRRLIGYIHYKMYRIKILPFTISKSIGKYISTHHFNLKSILK